MIKSIYRRGNQDMFFLRNRLIGEVIVVFLMMYVSLSTVEWGLHKYFMHNKITCMGSFIEAVGYRHITHHIATRQDMSIDKETDGYEKLGKEENMCLIWDSILVITALMLIFVFSISACLGVPVWIPLTILLILEVYSLSMWNTLHPAIHGRSGYDMGAPLAAREGTFAYDMLINSSLGQFLWRNHVLHHNIKKPYKTNFNITLPFADYVYGTHSSYVRVSL